MFATNARMAGCRKPVRQRTLRSRAYWRLQGRAARRRLARQSLIVGLLLGLDLLLAPQVARADSPADPVPAEAPARAIWPAEPGEAVSSLSGLNRPPAERSRRSGAAKRRLKNKRKSLTYRDRVEDVEFTLQGLYGRARRPVPEAESLLKNPKLLRLRSEIGSGDFRFVGSLGSDLHPKRIGRSVDWQALGSYSLGDWSLGLGYSHTLKLEADARFKGEAQQALRGAVGYAISERFRASASAVAWEPWNDPGGDPRALAAYLSFSLDF